MKHIQLFEEFVDESKSIKAHMAKAAEYKRDLMDLKKQAKSARDPQAHQARIAAKEEQLRRVADVIRGLRADGVNEGSGSSGSGSSLSKDQYKKMIAVLKKDGATGYDIILALSKDLSITPDEVISDLERYRIINLTESSITYLTEAKDLRQLQRALDKLQNDYEAVLDDDALEALTQLIRSVNLKLK